MKYAKANDFTEDELIDTKQLHIPSCESGLTAEIEHHHRANCARIPHELSSTSA